MWYQTIINETKGPSDYLTTAYFRMGEIAERNREPEWESFFLKAIEILLKNKIMKDSELYRLASAYKKIDDLECALKNFKELLLKQISLNLKSGVYFHMGEIFFKKNEFESANEMFLNCLSINPDHKKIIAIYCVYKR